MAGTRLHPDLHTRPVTLRDVAERCGVSKQTVSRAIHGQPKVSPEVAAHIRDIALEMGYDPARQHAARRLKMLRHGKTLLNQVVAFFFPEYRNPNNYFSQVLWGVWSGLASAAYGMVMVDWHQPISPLFSREEIDGAIVLSLDSAETTEELIADLRSRYGFARLPIVSLLMPASGCASAMIDDEAGAYQAVRHLFELGHRQLLHFYPPATEHFILQNRLFGYYRACREFGLDPTRHLHALASFEWMDQHNGHIIAWTIEYLRAHPEVTAVLSRNDLFAVHLITAMRSAGIRVPEDISVIGCDDVESLPDAQGNNSLTTIHNPLTELGKSATAMIIRMINGEDTDAQVTMQPSLIIRGTTTRCKARRGTL